MFLPIAVYDCLQIECIVDKGRVIPFLVSVRERTRSTTQGVTCIVLEYSPYFLFLQYRGQHLLQYLE